MEQETNYGVVFGTIPLMSEDHLEIILTEPLLMDGLGFQQT